MKSVSREDPKTMVPKIHKSWIICIIINLQISCVSVMYEFSVHYKIFHFCKYGNNITQFTQGRVHSDRIAKNSLLSVENYDVCPFHENHPSV